MSAALMWCLAFFGINSTTININTTYLLLFVVSRLASDFLSKSDVSSSLRVLAVDIYYPGMPGTCYQGRCCCAMCKNTMYSSTLKPVTKEGAFFELVQW